MSLRRPVDILLCLAKTQQARRVPAFLESDNDNPNFEYLEEPDFGDSSPLAAQDEGEQQPPDGTDGGVVIEGTRIRHSLVLPSAPAAFSPVGAVLRSPPPPVTPRAKIVSARVQHDRIREEEEKGRAAQEARTDKVEVADIEGFFGERGMDDDRPRKKRGRARTTSLSAGQ